MAGSGAGAKIRDKRGAGAKNKQFRLRNTVLINVGSGTSEENSVQTFFFFSSAGAGPLNWLRLRPKSPGSDSTTLDMCKELTLNLAGGIFGESHGHIFFLSLVSTKNRIFNRFDLRCVCVCSRS